jgi:hypothetical protein
MAALGPGGVKTLAKTKRSKIGLSDRALFNDRCVGNGRRTPEKGGTSRFYTAWAETGR